MRDLTQEAAASLLGVGEVQLSKWERNVNRPRSGSLERVARGYGISLDDLLGPVDPQESSGEVITTFSSDAWEPSSVLRSNVPPRAYDVAVGHLRRLERAGIARDQMEEFERLMLDSRYAKANSRRQRDLTDDDHILLIESVWAAIQETLGIYGVHP